MSKPNAKLVTPTHRGVIPATEPTRLTRRRFLRTAGGILCAASVAELDVARFAHAAGSGTLRVGLIGCGGRGSGAAKGILATGPGIQLVAMGDLFEERMKATLNNLQTQFKTQVDVIRDRQFIGFEAYRMVIESGVDVLILATPPCFRPLHFEAAVNAGKHCFLEKNVAVDAPGVRRLLQANETAKKKALSAVTGYQRRFRPDYEAVVAKIQGGAIGQVTRLEAFWKGGQVWVQKRPDLQKKLGRPLTEMEFQLRNWIHFTWLSGGIALDPLAHNLDVCNWIMRTSPQSVRATSARREFVSSDFGDGADFFSAEYAYPSGVKMAAESYRLTGKPGKVAEIAYGTKGIAECNNSTITDPAGNPLWSYGPASTVDPYQREQDLFIESIRSGKPLNMIEDSANTDLTAIMGRTSAALGREVTWKEMLASTESFFPDGPLTWDTAPPTLPDKLGDYQWPARGRKL